MMRRPRERSAARRWRHSGVARVEISAPPASFHPLDLSPSLWYDAADIGGVAPGDPLDDNDGWPSHLVGGDKIVTAEATAPTYFPAGAGAPGELPAVSFNGIDEYGEVPSPGAAASAWTFYFVLSGIGGSGERRFFDAQTGRIILKWRESATGRLAYFEGSTQTTYGSTSTSDQILVFSLSAAAQIVRRNGVTLSADGTPTWTNRAINGVVNIGASITPGNYFQGRISEWLAFPAGHDLTTIAQMETWLDAKYGLLP